MNFSKKLYMLRTKAGLTQDEMADKFGVSRQTVYKWENEITYPEVDRIIRISEVFNVSIDYLLKDNLSVKINEDSVEKAVLQFLTISQDMNKISENIIEFMRDGVIDDSEKVQLEEIAFVLDNMIENIVQIKNAMFCEKNHKQL